MTFVWTVDGIVTAIMLGFLAIIILGCVFMYLIGCFTEWLKRLMIYRGIKKTHKAESEKEE